jgi:hypothetical protein
LSSNAVAPTTDVGVRTRRRDVKLEEKITHRVKKGISDGKNMVTRSFRSLSSLKTDVSMSKKGGRNQ